MNTNSDEKALAAIHHRFQQSQRRIWRSKYQPTWRQRKITLFETHLTDR